jgi:hypothetical protein
MASSVGGLIEAVDYNSIRNKVIAVLGAGNGNTGYGQDARINSTAVSAGSAVTALQWQNLRWDLYNILLHQNGAIPSITSVNTGDTVRFGVSHPNNAYDTLANTAVTNRFNLGAGQFVTESLGSKAENFTWSSQAYIDIAYTFSTATVARYFFNSGGKIRIASSFAAGLVNSQNAAWQLLLSGAGTQSFGGQDPSTGFSPLNGTNFYRLTNSFQTYYEAVSSTPYGANNYKLQARSNVADNSSGAANIVYIRALYTDGYTDGPNSTNPLALNPAPTDSVSGTMTVSSDMIRATGVMQTPPGTATFTTSGPTSDIASASFIRS